MYFQVQELKKMFHTAFIVNFETKDSLKFQKFLSKMKRKFGRFVKRIKFSLKSTKVPQIALMLKDAWAINENHF